MKVFCNFAVVALWIPSLVSRADAIGESATTTSFDGGFNEAQNEILLDAFRQIGDAAFKSRFSPVRSEVEKMREQEQRKHRKLLPNIPCNSLINRISTQELLGLVETMLGGFISDNATLTNAKAFLLSSAKYEIQVWKICGNCESALSLLASKANANASTAGDIALSTYCNSNVHGYNATHSSLVFVPEMQENQIHPGQLRTYLHMHASAFELSSAPTLLWPGNITVFLGNTYQATGGNTTLVAQAIGFTFTDFLAPLMFSSFGGVSVIPDYIGYGESAMFDRAYGILYLYRQAAGVAYLHTQEWLKNYTMGCSVMEDVASAGGVSEGGLSSIAGATALKGLGVRVLSVYSGAPPLNPSLQTAFVIKQYDTQNISSSQDASFLMPLATGFATASFSLEFPNMANTGTSQKMVSTAWNVEGNLSRNVPEWFAAPNPINRTLFFAFAPLYVPAMINDNLRALFQQAIAMNITDPCTSSMANTTGTNGTDKICQAMIENAASTILETADFPVVLCSSVNDTLVSPDQVRPTLFTSNPNVVSYTGFAGVPVGGDHGAASASCSLSPVIGFVTTLSMDDSPVKISNLTDASILAMCGSMTHNGTMPPTSSFVPTKMPTMKPTSPNKSPTKSPTSDAQAMFFSRLLVSPSSLSFAVFLATAATASLL